MARRDDPEKTFQYKSRQQALLDAELIDDKLPQLLTFIRRLEATPPGAAELKARVKRFGKCNRNEGETSGQFYGRLRHWLDRDILKSPRHAPRQSDDD